MDKKLKFDVPATLAAAPKDEEAPEAQEITVIEPSEPQPPPPRPIAINPGPDRPDDEALTPPTIGPGPRSPQPLAPPEPPPRVNPGPPIWDVESEPIYVNPGPDEREPRVGVQRAPDEDESSEEE